MHAMRRARSENEK